MLTFLQFLMYTALVWICWKICLYTSGMEQAMAPHSSTLAWKIPWMEEPGRLQTMGSRRVRHDWSDLAAYDLWDSLVSQMVKNLPTMQETWIRSLSREDPMEKEMATYSSILAWKIPWTEEPGGLPSTGSQRVRHDWATEHIHTLWVILKYFLMQTSQQSERTASYRIIFILPIQALILL